jgi:hypothetical protein
MSCPPGAHLALDPGDTFSPFVAGLDGVVLCEVLMGDPRSFPEPRPNPPRATSDRLEDSRS